MLYLTVELNNFNESLKHYKNPELIAHFNYLSRRERRKHIPQQDNPNRIEVVGSGITSKFKFKSSIPM